MTILSNLLQSCKAALPSTWKSASWLLKLMIPISLAVTLLKYAGVLDWLAQYLNPIFEYLGLPGASAIIFISGAAAGTYAGLAAMMSIELTMREATILGIMIALCHALPMECTVNKKTGSSFWGMAVIRLIAAFLCAYILNFWLSPNDSSYIYLGAGVDSSLYEVMLTWCWSQIKMAVMVFAIIYLLMVVQKMIETYQLMNKLTKLFAPLMTIFGLPQNVAYMWLVGNVLGLSYGSAIMLELEEKGMITQEEADAVNYHLIMNHSLLEDTIVLAATGIPALLLIVVRVSFATILVWLRRGIQTLRPSLFLVSILFALSLSAQNKNLPPPAMGWSSLNSFHRNLSKEEIANQAKQIVLQGLQGVGYQYVYVDSTNSDFANPFNLKVREDTTIHEFHDSWKIVKSIIRNGLYHSAYCTPSHYNDLDYLVVGRTLSPVEDETIFSLWCMLESPLLLTCDLSNLSATTRDLITNRELLSLNQNYPYQQAYVIKKSKDCYFLVKDVETTNGLKRAFAIYNSGENTQQFWVNFEDMDLFGEVNVRNLLEHADKGLFDQGMDISVPPHATHVYLLEAAERLDRVVYEAECAYAPAYIQKTSHHVQYKTDAECSGEVKVSGLGFDNTNYLEWRDVYINKGGRRRLQISYTDGEHCRFQIQINGHHVKDVATRGHRGVVTTITKLKSGTNTIRLTNPYGAMPSIDCLRITKY